MFEYPYFFGGFSAYKNPAANSSIGALQNTLLPNCSNRRLHGNSQQWIGLEAVAGRRSHHELSSLQPAAKRRQSTYFVGRSAIIAQRKTLPRSAPGVSGNLEHIMTHAMQRGNDLTAKTPGHAGRCHRLVWPWRLTLTNASHCVRKRWFTVAAEQAKLSARSRHDMRPSAQLYTYTTYLF